MNKLFKQCSNIKLINGYLFKKDFAGYGISHKEVAHNSPNLIWDFSPENQKRIDSILKRQPPKYSRSAIFPLLQIAMEQNQNWVPLAAMDKIAKICGVPAMDVQEVSTFQTMQNRKPMGHWHFQVCGTLSCMLRGADNILHAFKEATGCHHLDEVSTCGRFSVSRVECLGACCNAPMVQLNNKWYYEDLLPEDVREIVDHLSRVKPIDNMGDEDTFEKHNASPWHKVGPQVERLNACGPYGRSTLFKDEKDQDQYKEFKANQSEIDKEQQIYRTKMDNIHKNQSKVV